jgi:ferric-dicitrate binding protein FerR (iron transport regulator)
MSLRNNGIAALVAADAPAARDLAFEMAVLLRIERRRYRRGIAAIFAMGAAAMLVLAVVMPALTPVAAHAATGLGNWALAAALLALSLPLQGWIARRF